MRMLLHATTRSTALSPSAVVSLVAHAAFFGGAMYGNGRDASVAEQPKKEQIYFLYTPPPDRAPPSRASEGQLRYVPGGAGASQGVAPVVQPAAKGSGGTMESSAVARSRGELSTTPMTLPLASSDDSVYSALSVDDSVARDLGSAAPVYPLELLAKRIEGSVTARYVIDTAGHPESATAEILSATHDEFARSVREALPLMHFRAGSVAGRHVRQLVEQQFLFRIAPPAPPAADNTRTRPTG